MEKQKLLVSFVEKVPPVAPVQLKSKLAEYSSLPGLFVLTADGKQLVRLHPDTKRSQLIGVLTEKNEAESRRQVVRIDPKCKAEPVEQLPDENGSRVKTSQGDVGISKHQKIPRPANAFMLFANEWRKKLAVENPRESNKDISVRLGILWKTMSKDVKEKYFVMARQVDAEHKRKYPDYVYNPKEARLRKAMREQSRSQQQQQQQQQQSGVLGPAAPSRQQTSPGVAAAAAAASNSGSNRIIVPWSFPLHAAASVTGAPPPPTHPPPTKPILSSPRATHRSKEPAALRKQLEYGYHQQPDYGPCRQDEYGCDYEGQQKWHPYQNGMNQTAAYHSRSALMSKMSSLQHRGMVHHQPSSAHSQPATPTSSAWGQYCNVPYPTSQSAMMRSRHMAFLQEQQQHQQQQSQHCGGNGAGAVGGYQPEMQMSYESKMQDDLTRRLHSSYSQPEHQIKSSSTMATSGLQPQQLQQQPHHQQHQQQQHNEPVSKYSSDSVILREEDGPRWGSTGENGLIIERPSSVSSSSCTADAFFESEPQPPSTLPGISKQPLPGFQQAFGSTEIGKFSRSELFASLVKAANVSSSLSSGSDGEQQQQQQLQQQQRAHSYESCSARSSSPEPLAGSQNGGSYGQGGPGSDLSDGGNSTNPSTPRWHSPYGGDL